MKHLVRHGDTLGDLARRYDVTVDDLMKANPHILDKNLIYAGDTIELPWGAVSPTRTLWGKVKDLLK